VKYALSLLIISFVNLISLTADEPVTKAFIDGNGQGWVTLGEKDFVNVNCDPDTFAWKKDGSLYCKGLPIGVARSQKQYTNFELVLYWKHLKSGGNSGVFVWAPEKPLFALKRNQLPHGIEVQVLDHGYTEQYEKSSGKKATWFTTNGDLFPVGSSKMKPFPPTSPDGCRSFPRKNLSRGINEWNHYYVRAINGEIRLWVNGEEVSGGNHIEPRTGYLCLESEGSPIEFKEIRLRELP
jgi:Domain of Unknown Function (DUF1080)